MTSIVVVGCSHSSAPLPLLERLSIPSSALGDILARVKSAAREGLVLSTCNRTEIYCVAGHASSGGDAMLRVLAERASLDVEELRPHAYVCADAAAARHALKVASGLDSMVLGEDQIQAQWKRALAHARVAETLGPVLDRLGAAALACGKRVRNFTGVGRHAVSLESLAVRAATARLGDLDQRELLVIGAGESAASVIRHLQSSADARITVMSRSLERADVLAHQLHVRSASVEAIVSAVASADAVFCCTSAPHPVLGAAHFSERVSRRPADPIVCVDLGMPRDVDVSVASMGGVQVIALEELAELAATHREERRQHLPAAEAIVEVETARFLDWKTARGSAAAIARLQAHARQIADMELDVALTRLQQLSSHDREIVMGMARRIVKKLMHAPTELLKHHPEADNIALALECAFGIPGAADRLERHLPQTSAAQDAPESIEEAS